MSIYQVVASNFSYFDFVKILLQKFESFNKDLMGRMEESDIQNVDVDEIVVVIDRHLQNQELEEKDREFKERDTKIIDVVYDSISYIEDMIRDEELKIKNLKIFKIDGDQFIVGKILEKIEGPVTDPRVTKRGCIEKQYHSDYCMEDYFNRIKKMEREVVSSLKKCNFPIGKMGVYMLKDLDDCVSL